MSYDERLNPVKPSRGWPDWLIVSVLIGAILCFFGGVLWIVQKDRSDWDRVTEWHDGGIIVSIEPIPGEYHNSGTLIRTDTHTFTTTRFIGSIPLNVRARYGDTRRNGAWITFDGHPSRYPLVN